MPKLAAAVRILGVDVVFAREDYRDDKEAYSEPLCYVVRCVTLVEYVRVFHVSE